MQSNTAGCINKQDADQDNVAEQSIMKVKFHIVNIHNYCPIFRLD